MNRLILTALLWSGVALANPLDHQTENGVFSRGESFSYSAANPLTAYLNVLVGPAPRDGTYAISRNSIELGYRWRRVELSLIHRNDQNLYFSQGAAEFAYLNKNRKTIPLDKLYPVDVEANQYQLTGLKAGYSLPITDSFEVFGYYALYYASEAVAGYLGKDPEGNGGYVGVEEISSGGITAKNIAGELYADYVYTDDPLFRRQVNAPSGQGYSIDLGFRWRMLPTLTLEAAFYDALGEISWDDLPHTEARATSNTLILNDEGFIEAQPNFAGKEDFRDFTQDLTHRELVTLDYRYKHLRLGYQFDRMKVVTFHRLVGGYYWSDQWGLIGSYDLTSSAIGLRLAMPAGQFAITLDDLDLDNAHTLGLSWNFTYRF